MNPLQSSVDAIHRIATSIQNGELQASTRKEIELVMSQLNVLENAPPHLKRSEFRSPYGEEIEIPNPAAHPNAVLERIIDESDLLPVWFLEQGVKMQRSVARVVLTKPHTVDNTPFFPGTGWATGFMVSPNLLLTNHHVIPDIDFAKKLRFQFNFQLGSDGSEQPSDSFFPSTNGIFRTNVALDYTLIQLQQKESSTSGASIAAGERWGFIQLNEKPTFRKNQRFNIVQHPAGRRKEIALQNNRLLRLCENVVFYGTDTEPGSSGSPVFDNLWQIIAIHHAGGEQSTNGEFVNNAGIRIDKIVEDLRAHFAGEAVLAELGI